MDYWMQLLEGFFNNLLVTVLSMLFPLVIGTLFCFFASESKIFASLSHWISLPFECLCPLVLLVLCYFNVPIISSLPCAILTFSFCFMGYMPARHVREHSFAKNILYHGLGLFSSLYKWSFCIGYVAIPDLLRTTNLIRNNTYETFYLWFALLGSVAVLFVVEVARRLIQQFMK